MNRKLIFITNDGGTGNYLPGVGIDKRNYLQFFSSDEGGAWDLEEEKKEFQCDKNSLRLYLQALSGSNDYLLIVFLGHGYVRNDNETMFELQNGDEISLSEIRLWTRTTRSLFIADSCRVRIPLMEDGGQMPEVRMFTESGDSQHRESCKRAYDNRINLMRQGAFTTGMATSLDEEAHENDRTGGCYSYALLESAKEFIDDRTKTGICSFSWIHAQAKTKVRQRTQGEQNPEYIGVRFFVPPFVVKV